MRELTDEEIYREVSNIVEQFGVLECLQCAQTLMQWLAENGIEGKLLKLSTKYRDEDYIISECLGSDESITINGKHYGVEVKGQVFDNLSTRGMIREDWLNDFHCPSDEFILEELEEI